MCNSYFKTKEEHAAKVGNSIQFVTAEHHLKKPGPRFLPHLTGF
jgi:hypothetical protein